MRPIHICAITLAATLIAAAISPAFAYTGESMEKSAAISIDKAKSIALATEPGRIADTELEMESGGSGLRYSFDVKPKSGGATHEIGIDANTGAVLENSVDGSNPD